MKKVLQLCALLFAVALIAALVPALPSAHFTASAATLVGQSQDPGTAHHPATSSTQSPGSGPDAAGSQSGKPTGRSGTPTSEDREPVADAGARRTNLTRRHRRRSQDFTDHLLAAAPNMPKRSLALGGTAPDSLRRAEFRLVGGEMLSLMFCISS
jgi:hypothetical protein